MPITLISLNIGEGGSKKAAPKSTIGEGNSKRDIPATTEVVKEVLQGIATLITNEQADIVALQEVDRRTMRCHSLDGLNVITMILNEKGPAPWNNHFFKTRSFDGGEYGIATLDRLNLIKFRSVPLGKTAQSVDREERAAICKKYSLIEGSKTIYLWVINVHLSLNEDDQRIQLEKLRGIIEGTTAEKAIIICGDFNIVEDLSTVRQDKYKGISYDELTQKLFIGTHREFTDLGPKNEVTFPAPGRGRKIDYMFFSANKNTNNKVLTATEANIINAASLSDHHALKVTFSIT